VGLAGLAAERGGAGVPGGLVGLPRGQTTKTTLPGRAHPFFGFPACCPSLEIYAPNPVHCIPYRLRDVYVAICGGRPADVIPEGEEQLDSACVSIRPSASAAHRHTCQFLFLSAGMSNSTSRAPPIFQSFPARLQPRSGRYTAQGLTSASMSGSTALGCAGLAFVAFHKGSFIKPCALADRNLSRSGIGGGKGFRRPLFRR